MKAWRAFSICLEKEGVLGAGIRSSSPAYHGRGVAASFSGFEMLSRQCWSDKRCARLAFPILATAVFAKWALKGAQASSTATSYISLGLPAMASPAIRLYSPSSTILTRRSGLPRSKTEQDRQRQPLCELLTCPRPLRDLIQSDFNVLDLPTSLCRHAVRI